MEDKKTAAGKKPFVRFGFRGIIRWNSLQVIMSVVMLGLSLSAVLIITQLIYSYASNTINHSVGKNNERIVEEVSKSIDGYIKEMETISDTIRQMLTTEPAQSLNERVVMFLRDDIDTVTVIDENDKAVFCTDKRQLRDDLDLEGQSWFKDSINQNTAYQLSVPHVQRLFRGDYPWVITLTSGVTWVKDGVAHKGIVMVDMNFNRIRDLCARDFENYGYLYIVSNNGNIIYHPMQQMIYAGIQPEQYKLTAGLNDGSAVIPSSTGALAVSVKTLSSAPWKIVGVSTQSGLETYGSGLKSYIITAVALLALALLAASVVVSRGMALPLRQLVLLMGRVSGDEEDIVAPEKGVFEIRRLSRSFNKMVQRIKQLMSQIKDEQEQLRRSELKALYAQINPHFLYNTLDSVVWLAQSGEEKSVVQMVMALARFFRLSLSGGKESISVEEELQQVDNYLIIQQVRFESIFVYHITCADDVRLALTPKTILQPLVENAIVHGFGASFEDGVISISAKKQDDLLILEVHDNGCGIPPEKLARILETDSKSRNGIGLKNVHERIRLACGLQYGLELESQPDEGTTVRARLPLLFDDSQKEADT